MIKLKRVLAGILAISIVSTGTLTGFATDKSETIKSSAGEEILVASSEYEVNIPEDANPLHLSDVPLEDSVLQEVNVEDIQDYSTLIDISSGNDPFIATNTPLSDGVVDEVPDYPAYTLNVPEGKAGVQILTHTFPQVNGRATSEGTIFVVAVIDRRENQRPVSIVLRANGQTAAPGIQIVPTGEVTYQTISITGALNSGVNSITGALGGSDLINNTTPVYEVNTTNISDIVLEDVKLLEIAEADSFKLEFTMFSSVEYRNINLRYIVKAAGTTALLSNIGEVRAGTKSHIITVPRSPAMQGGENTLQLQLNDTSTLFEINSGNNTKSFTVVFNQKHAPGVALTVTDSLISNTPGAIQPPYRVDNRGKDPITDMSVSFYYNNNKFHTDKVNLAVGESKLLSTDLTWETVTTLGKAYGAGTTELGTLLPNGGWGGTFEIRIDEEGKYPYTPGAVEPPPARIVSRGIYWEPFTNKSIDIVSRNSGAVINPGVVNNFDVTIKNHDIIASSTATYELYTGNSTGITKVYGPAAITLAPGETKTVTLGVLAPNVYGTNYVRARLVETDTDGSDNLATALYTVGDAEFVINTTAIIKDFPNNGIIAGSPLTLTLQGRIDVYNDVWWDGDDETPGANPNWGKDEWWSGDLSWQDPNDKRFFDNLRVAWFVDGKEVHKTILDVYASTDWESEYTFDTSTWKAGAHKIHAEIYHNQWYTDIWGNYVKIHSKTDTVTVNVITPTSIYIPRAYAANPKPYYTLSDKIGIVFEVANYTQEDLVDLKVQIQFVGSTFTSQVNISRVPSMKMQAFSVEYPAIFYNNGMLHSLEGATAVKVSVNVLADGKPQYPDDSLSDNVFQFPITVRDTTPKDLDLFEVVLENPGQTYNERQPPLFRLNCANRTGVATRVRLEAIHEGTVVASFLTSVPSQMQSGLVGAYIILPGEGTKQIYWRATALDFTDEIPSNNTSQVFTLTYKTPKDLAVAAIETVPSTAREGESIKVTVEVTNPTFQNFENVTVNLTLDGREWLTFIRSFQALSNSKFSYTLGSAAFKDFPGVNQLTVALLDIDDDIASNNHMSTTVQMTPADDIWLVQNQTFVYHDRIKAAVNGGATQLLCPDTGRPLVDVPLVAVVDRAGMAIQYPDCYLKMYIKERPDFNFVDMPVEGLLLPPSGKSSTESGETDVYWPLVTDGKAGTYTLVIELLPGIGYPWGDTTKTPFPDSDLTNNKKEIQITVPEIKFHKNLTANITHANPFRFDYGGDLEFGVIWSAGVLESSPGEYKRTTSRALRTIHIGGVLMWSSTDEFFTQGPAMSSNYPYSFTTAELLAAGVPLAPGGSVLVTAEVNGDLGEEEWVNPLKYPDFDVLEDNFHGVNFPISSYQQPDFTFTALRVNGSSTPSTINPGQVIEVTAVAHNALGFGVQNAAGTDWADIDYSVLLNGVTVGTYTYPRGGGKTQMTVKFNVVVPATATGSQTIEVLVNPSKTIPETNYNNNTSSIYLPLSISTEGLDFSVVPVKPEVTVQRGEAATVAFSAAVTGATPEELQALSVSFSVWDGEKYEDTYLSFDSSGQSTFILPLPTSVINNLGLYYIEADINWEWEHDEDNRENNRTEVAVLVTQGDAGADYSVNTLTATPAGAGMYTLSARFMNNSPEQVEGIECQFWKYKYSTSSWERTNLDAHVDLAANNGALLSGPTQITSDYVNPSGEILFRATINADSKFPEENLSNNLAEITHIVATETAIELDFIRAVTTQDALDFRTFTKNTAPAHRDTALIGDTVNYLISVSNTNPIFGAGTSELLITLDGTSSGPAFYSQTVNLQEMGPGSNQMLVVSLPAQYAETVLATAKLSGADVSTTQSEGSCEVTVVTSGALDLFADRVTVKNLTVGSGTTITAGDAVSIHARLGSDIEAAPDTHWRVFLRNAANPTQTVTIYDSRPSDSVGLPRGNIVGVDLDIDTWDYIDWTGATDVVLEIDPDDLIAEAREDNNIASVRVNLVNIFDLSWEGDSFGSYYNVGDILSGEFYLKSLGISPNPTTQVQIYKNSTLVWSGTAYTGVDTAVTYNHQILEAGNIELKIVVNADSSVSEINHNNNEYIKTIIVGDGKNIYVPSTRPMENLLAPGRNPFEMGDFAIASVPVSASGIVLLDSVWYRTRVVLEGGANTSWVYAYATESGIALPEFELTLQIDDHVFYGNIAVELEVNPPVTAAIIAEWNTENPGAPAPSTTGRLYEEENYTDNKTIMAISVKEEPDLQVYWTTAVNGESVVENTVHTRQFALDLKGTAPDRTYAGVKLEVLYDGVVASSTTLDISSSYWTEVPTYRSITLPTTLGQHDVTLRLNNDGKYTDINPANNSAAYSYTVTPDTSSVNYKVETLTRTSPPYAAVAQTFSAVVNQTGPATDTSSIGWTFGTLNKSTGVFVQYAQGTASVIGRTVTIPVTTTYTGAAGDTPNFVFYWNPTTSVSETSYLDNSKQLSYTMLADPIDIVAKTVSTAGEVLEVGTAINVSTTAYNDSPSYLSGVQVDVWIDGERVGSAVTDMQPYTNTTVAIPTQLPSTQGVFPMEIRWNATSTIVEAEFTNNTLNATLETIRPQIDLVVGNIIPQATNAKLNSFFVVNVDFENVSAGLENPRALKDVNYIIEDELGNLLFHGVIMDLPLDTPHTETVTCAVPTSRSYGTMALIFKVNPDIEANANFIGELDHTNNEAASTIYIDPPSNILFKDTELTKTVYPEGEDVVVQGYLENKNPTKTETPVLEVWLRYTDLTGVGRMERVHQESMLLPTGGTHSFHVAIPNLDLGDYQIELFVNSEKIIEEDTYDDNLWTGKFEVRPGKDFEAAIEMVSPVVAAEGNTSFTVRFKSAHAMPSSAPFRVTYQGTLIDSGILSFTGKETITKNYTQPAGSSTGFFYVVAEINTADMSVQEYDISNNLASELFRVREHNTNLSVDGDKINPTHTIELPADRGDISAWLETEDPTSIIEKIRLPDGTELHPGDGDATLNLNIAPGETLIVVITVITDDGTASREYTLTFYRPTDFVDATAYATADGVRINAVRTDNTFIITMPTSTISGQVTIEATEDLAYISEYKGASVNSVSITETELQALFLNRILEFEFKASSGTGAKTETYVVRIVMDNNAPTIQIINTAEIHSSIYSQYGRYTSGVFYGYGNAITAMEEAISSGKLQGIPVEVEAHDTDLNQYMFAEVIFMGDKYPVTWESYSGGRTVQTGSPVRGYAYIPKNKLASNTQDQPLVAQVFDTVVDGTSNFLATGNSSTALVSVDISGPTFTVDVDEENKTMRVFGVTDNLVGARTVYVRYKSRTLSSWLPVKSFDATTSSGPFAIDLSEMSRDIDIEVWAEDILNNVSTRATASASLPASGTTVSFEGAYMTVSRKSNAVFINVRYRTPYDIDLTGFSFLP